jgi:two-component system sensor histidine kinase YesM
MVDRGSIKVTAQVFGEKILLQVIDNGIGMDGETAINILSKKPKGKISSGIGVKNVHERIQLYFGSEYGLEINSELEIGTCVKIWLPKLET